MATKSDFAQKLLFDLRLRKERMAASQGSSRDNATVRDSYRNPGNVQRGSRQTKSLESIGGSKRMSQHLGIKESSQQIVPYAGGQHHRRSESVGDLSMAFTYAVKNNGKLINMDFSNSSNNTKTMIDFLHQIGRGSLDVAGDSRNGAIIKHRPNSPALTTIQIKEISKGVQNLYEIIRTNSNGNNVNRYSMEIGNELLKGAKGLEESLRMLVNLGEASELMVKPQRKNRITLLEVDDDDDPDDSLKTLGRNQVALPRFSFDNKNSRKSNLTLTDGSVRFSTHRRSDSGGGESVRSVRTEVRSEKGRISNVIAKLMGLEEVPAKIDSKRDEIKKGDDLSANSVNKICRPVKDVVVSLNDRKIEKIHDDSNANGSPRRNQNNRINNRLDRISDKQEKKMSVDQAKEKTYSKRRSSEVVGVEKKKTIRREKNNEIKLVPRNNSIQEQETRRTQRSKKDSQEVKHTNLPSKELKAQPVEQNLKDKELTPKAQEPERRQQKTMSVTRKKVDSVPISRTESPRTKEEVLKRRNRSLANLSTPSKHKLSVLKETKMKDVGIHITKQKETNATRLNTEKSESATRANEIVPACEEEIKSDPQITSEIVVNNVGSTEEIIETSNLPENKPKKAFNSSIQVVLTESEKQLKEILIKDQLFLSTAEALFRLNIPVGYLHIDDHNHHQIDTKLKLDCGYEILKRKARSQELSLHPYAQPSIGDTAIRFLDELVKQLYKDLEDLRLYGRDTRNDYDETDYLHHMLENDIHNKNPNINSFWDFGWNVKTFTFVEKDEFVKDVEQDVFQRLVDEIVDDILCM